ncbi:hypothetical protein [Flagellimonas pacifica]|uniref:Lipocalin-like domain-containing protein n=1 Tax=Flagellimonas pacifica TaxID=1247520 RepID=A0A285MT48_9FLAO|nr:hypothetical protein [Allomuricauda parva]SNZ00379.1 hypothetical protein SAMN06265377_2201 [Allomuricauda parva]
MKKILILYSFFLLIGCHETTISKEDLTYLNGYWEISEVEFSDGAKKNYSVNPTIDFIHLENMEGFRKKVQPKFNGTYNISQDVEAFKIQSINDSYILIYKNNLIEREEKLTHLDPTSFSVLNEEGVLYSYSRFQPIVIPK